MKCNRCGNYLGSWDTRCEICGEVHKKVGEAFTVNTLIDWIKFHKAITALAVIIIYLIIFK